MPIIKSAKKRARQSLIRQDRNYNVRTALKKSMRALFDACKEGNKDEAEKLLPKAYKCIDTACKKGVLKKNTAARRKSLLARSIAQIGKKKVEKVEKVAKAEKPAKKAKKAE